MKRLAISLFMASIVNGTVHAQSISTYDMTVDTTLKSNASQQQALSRSQHTELVNTVSGAGKAIVQAGGTTTTQITNTLEVLHKYRSADDNVRWAIEQKRKNAEQYSANNGAKAKAACGIFKRAAAVTSGRKDMEEIFERSIVATQDHFESEVGNADGELTAAGQSVKLINQFSLISDYTENGDKIDDGLLTSPINRSLNTAPMENGLSELSLHLNRNHLLVNPTPDKLPANYKDANQPIAQAMANAKSVIKNEKLMEAANVLNEITSRRAAIFDKDWIDYFFSVDTEIGQKMKTTHFGESTEMGYAATMESINNMRLNDVDWLRKVGAQANNTGLLRDQNLMMAQMLANQQEVINLLKSIAQLTALSYAEQVNENAVSNKNSLPN